MARSTDLYTRLLLDAKEFTQGLEKAKRDTLGFGKTTTVAGKGVDMLKGIVGKLGVAIGAAGGAYEALTKTMDANRELSQQWKGTIEGGKVALDHFYTALGSGDWSNFTNGISDAISQGIQLERILTSLHDKMTAFGLVEGEARATLEEQKRIIESKTASPQQKEAARKLYMEQINKLDEQAKGAEQQAMAAARGLFEKYGQVKGITDAQMTKYLTEYLGGTNAQYNAWERKMAEADRQGGNSGFWARQASYASADDAYKLRQAQQAAKELRDSAPREFAQWYGIKQKLSPEELDQIANQVKEAQQLRQRRDSYTNSTKELEAKFDKDGRYIEATTVAVTRGATVAKKAVEEVKTPLEQIDTLINSITKELSFPTDTTDVDALRVKLEQLKKDKAELERAINTRLNGVDDLLIKPKALDVPISPFLANVELQKTKQKLTDELGVLEATLSVTLDIEERKKIEAKIADKKGDIDYLSKATSELVIKRPNTEAYNDGASSIIDTNNTLMASFEAVGSTVSMISSAFTDGGSSALQYAVNVVTAVSRVIGAIVPLIAVKKAEATANAASATTGAASAVASVPFAGPMMAVSAVASLIAVLANTPKFATGGVVGGNSYYGDKILARVNSGELILNTQQQRQIYHQLQPVDGVAAGTSNVEFKIRGQELVGILNSYNRRTSRS